MEILYQVFDSSGRLVLNSDMRCRYSRTMELSLLDIPDRSYHTGWPETLRRDGIQDQLANNGLLPGECGDFRQVPC